MQRIFILIFIAIFNCKSIDPLELDEPAYDFDVDEVHVIANEHDINVQYLSYSINNLNELLIEYENINLLSMLKDTPMYLEYVTELDSRGIYRPFTHTAQIRWEYPPDTEEWALCVERYYVPAHEILHYVAWELYNIEDHSPEFFYNYNSEYNVEYQIYWKVRDLCGG